MSQHDYVIANGTGAAVRSDLNGALGAIVTQNSGSTEPVTTYAYMRWADTAAGVMKMRNGANSGWITLYQLDGEWTSIAFENGSAAAPSIYFKDSGTDTGFYSPGADQVGITTGGTVRLTTSTTAFTGTLPWRGQDGTAAAPAISFNSDTDTGIYSIGANQLGIASNGVERANIGTTEVVWNDSGADIDFRVEGDTKANLFKVDAGTDTVSVDGTFATGNVNYPTEGSLSGRNRIINGDMRIDQRNAGASVTPNNSYTLDRWMGQNSQTSKYTVQQSSVNASFFTKSLLATSSSAYSVTSSDYFFLNQPIEAFNVDDIGFGTAGAKSLTLSFWVRSSLTGTFGGSIRNYATDRSYPFSYTVSSANTFEYKTVTIPGDTSGTWVAGTNSIGLYLSFCIGAGSSFLATAGSWAAGNFVGPTGQTSVVGTNGATFYITGVQLEAGSVATPFERRSYGQELALCQRYYAKLGANAAASSDYQAYAAGCNQGNNTTQNFNLVFPQPLRASPTIAFSGSIGVFVDGTYINASLSTAYPGTTSALLQTSSSAVGTRGQGAVLLSNGSTTAFISLTAEL